MESLKPSDIEYFGIRRVWFEIAIILILAVVGMYLMVPGVLAQENASYAVIETPDNTTLTATTFNATTIPIQRIKQGGCVELGETIDIAGIGWYTGIIAYYGRYYDGYAGAGNALIKDTYSVEASKLDELQIYPDFFATRLGWWYNYDPFETSDTESHAYERLFYISTRCTDIPTENETILNEAEQFNKAEAAKRANLSRLDTKTEPGIQFIIPKNEAVAYDAPAGSHMWVLGKTGPDKYYDMELVGGKAGFSKEMLAELPAGNYDIVFVKPGANGIIEEKYSDHSIVSPFVGEPTVDVYGLTPELVEPKLIERVKASKDDAYETWKVAIQEPKILIARVAQAEVQGDRIAIVVSGYTNANQGGTVGLYLDDDKGKTAPLGISPILNNGGGGAYRVWNTSSIIDNDEIAQGDHFLTAISNAGAWGTVPIYGRKESVGSAKPQSFITYLDNSPFIPPVFINTTVTVTVPGPTRIVTVKITPSPKEINDAGTSVATGWATILAAVAAVLVVIGLIARWLISVYRRAKL